jgi:glycerophosphoryl diester phosphodiesterase
MKKIQSLAIFFICFLLLEGCLIREKIVLPERGLCAHRGAMETYPENTLPAFRAAVKAGAQMIEFDVFLTKDNQIVVIHDSKVDRTTNGKGNVAELTLDEIKKLDAGSWKAPTFAGEQIPIFQEVLNVMPYNIWLNIHVKGEDQLPVMVAKLLKKENRLHQAFMACGVSAATKAKLEVPEIKICNMERQEDEGAYVQETIRLKNEFIQLRKADYPDFAANVKMLKENGIRVNFFGTDSPELIKMLFENGVDFPLVNDILRHSALVRELNIQPLQPVFKY